MSNETISIRCGELSDLSALVSFNQAMAIETEGKHLPADILTRGVENLLRDKKQGQYFIAVEADKSDKEIILGALMVTFEWSDWRNGRFWWIQSVYVDPEHRRRGVYSLLHQQVKELSCRDNHCCGIRLYVEKENSAAQATYAHLGMRKTHYYIFEEEYSSSVR